MIPLWIETIRGRLGSEPDRTLAAEVGVSKASVAAWRKRLGIAPPEARAWTADEESFLRLAYESATCNEDLDLPGLATQLGRTYASVAIRASRLGLGDFTRRDVPARKVRTRKFATDAERRAAVSERTKRYIAEHGHPRGALGMVHTEAALATISAKSKALWAAPNSPLRTDAVAQTRSDNTMRMMMNRPAEKQYSRGKGGRRADLGNAYFRSSWEANYARWLNLLVSQGSIKGWAYEPQVFVFHTISRGCRTYTPDFRVDLNSGGHEWHEVKGWMDPKSKTRLDRMARHYPAERVVVIGADWFRDANRKGVGRMLPGWEGAA